MPLTRRDALRYATAACTLAGLNAATAARTPPAAAAAPTLIDYAMRQIPAQDIRAAGHAGVINYVSTSRPGSSFGAKPITLPYAKSLTAAGSTLVTYHPSGSGYPVVSYTIGPDGALTENKRLDGTMAYDAELSPDGSRLLVTDYRNGYGVARYHATTLDPDGTFATGAYPDAVAWSPDGARFAGVLSAH